MIATNYFKARHAGPCTVADCFPFDDGDFVSEGVAHDLAARVGSVVVWKRSRLYPEVPVVGEGYEKRPRLFLSLAGATTPFPKAH